MKHGDATGVRKEHGRTMQDQRDMALARLRHLRLDRMLPAARELVLERRRSCPDDMTWQMEAANQDLFEGDPDAALAVFEALARIEGFGGALECLLKSAELRARRGDFTAAFDILATTRLKYPDYDGTDSVRRQILLLADVPQRGPIQDMVKAARMGPTSIATISRAIEMLAGYTAHNGDDHEMALELGRLLRLAGRHAEAVSVLASPATAKGYAGRLESMIELARAWEAVRNPGAAWDIVSTIGTEFPAHSAFSTLVVEFLARRGRSAEAIGILGRLYPGLEPGHRSPALAALAEARATRMFEAGLIPGKLSVSMLVAPAEAMPLVGAGIIILTKDEADILMHNLVHHYRLGFRNFCLVDNQSHDGTADCIARFRAEYPDALVFSCHDQIAGHYQADKMGLFMDVFVGYARLAGITLDWLFFLDTDELLACIDRADAEKLRIAMADKTYDIIVFHWLLCASPAPLRSTPSASSPFESFNVVEPTFPPTSKIALRVGSGCRPTEGNHWISGFDGDIARAFIAAEHGWLMFHFTIRSFDQLRSKVVNGGRAFLDTSGLETHGGHWKERYARYLDEGDAFIGQLLLDHVRSVRDGGFTLEP
ncbi:hypothetical protein HN018_14930 [Lichenicola cladoniae]|uniref:Glycosyl transferase family 2 n=1 Tax=Lichenicola cladoniae TaxID=1484109 RepID=A0A6M8HSB4_9PROT|nr:glycosyltransferase family 2 protein [Lichenicola cladoniae]NPD65826.1 hypothetical protein [Acetobacteraceae bacterium]QKE91166.1 hypothetical protein HN018_14930 [Lichenicola cladoniae]